MHLALVCFTITWQNTGNKIYSYMVVQVISAHKICQSQVLVYIYTLGSSIHSIYLNFISRNSPNSLLYSRCGAVNQVAATRVDNVSYNVWPPAIWCDRMFYFQNSANCAARIFFRNSTKLVAAHITHGATTSRSAHIIVCTALCYTWRRCVLHLLGRILETKYIHGGTVYISP